MEIVVTEILKGVESQTKLAQLVQEQANPKPAQAKRSAEIARKYWASPAGMARRSKKPSAEPGKGNSESNDNVQGVE
jgi:hypothetical protein